jgi:radical SAM protein with 4Fe4S-binding SPASM domain
MNEPLLDPELPKRIAYIAARKTPPQYIKITSHCGLLTERMSKGLLDSGLDKLKVSIQGLDPKIYWDLMKLPLDRTLRNIDRFLELKEQGRYKSPRIEAVIVDTIKTHDQIPRFRRYWQERGIKIRIEPLENRANHESIHDRTVGVRSLQPFSWCRRLMEQIYVLHDGRMVQCCADWEQNSIMGDLTTESLEDVWYGKRYSDYRHRLAVGKVKGMICKTCRKQPPGI